MITTLLALTSIIPRDAAHAQTPDLVGIYAATVEAFWGNRSADSTDVEVVYNIGGKISESYPTGPLFDTTAMRATGIDPAIELLPVMANLSSTDRDRLEARVLEHRAIRMIFLSEVERAAIPRGEWPEGFWKGFRARFPGVRDLLGISRIAIDSSGTVAAVEIGTSCGVLCGHGNAFLLRRDGDEWKVVMPSRVFWVS